MFSRIIRFLFAVYAYFVFLFWIISALFTLVFYKLFLNKKHEKTIVDFIFRTLGRGVTFGLFLKLVPHYQAKYNAKTGYVVVSNHAAVIDIPSNMLSSPKTILFKFLGKAEAGKVPLFGPIVKTFCILVDRKDKVSRKESYTEMKHQLNKGFSVLIYAEGTRNRTNQPLKEMYDGAFRLAIETQTPIVVNTLVGTKFLNPPQYLFNYRPGTVHSYWSKPISVNGFTLDDLPRLKQQVRAEMLKHLKHE